MSQHTNALTSESSPRIGILAPSTDLVLLLHCGGSQIIIGRSTIDFGFSKPRLSSCLALAISVLAVPYRIDHSSPMAIARRLRASSAKLTCLVCWGDIASPLLI